MGNVSILAEWLGVTALVESKTRNFEIIEIFFARLNTQFKENLAINKKKHFGKKTPLKFSRACRLFDQPLTPVPAVTSRDERWALFHWVLHSKNFPSLMLSREFVNWMQVLKPNLERNVDYGAGRLLWNSKMIIIMFI